ncbi:MAG TPA: hypothetical protein VNA04_08725 [Thermoanaerobaculia bacterium]|nr:hypothetical protein [Thermoanaerobaculia bacterium]
MDDDRKVVLRYRDGRTERVSLESIDIERQVVSVVRESGDPAEIAFSALKAVFFPQSDGGAAEPASGSQLAVEFADGEVIRGLAHYNPERNGFVLFPLDRSKNDRIFVVNSAIVSIEVERL